MISARPAILFLGAIGLFVTSLLIVMVVGNRQLKTQREMALQLQALNQLSGVLSTLQDVETGQRGYLLTGEESYLQPYKDGVKRLQAQLDELRRFAAEGSYSVDSAKRVAELSGEKLAELDQTILLRRDNHLDAALSIVRTDSGKSLMDKIRAEISRMRETAQAQFDQASRRATRAEALRAGTFITSGLLNLAFLGWAFVRISQEIRTRETAIIETNRQKETLATTLLSIADAVIITDAQGHITFLNPEAERLTGWKTADAAKKPLTEAFQIVNEGSRQQVESPVEKVLRLGKAQGLANHTVLLAKDGSETSIDDSAAPIRERNGAVAGVVLVFRDVAEERANVLAIENSLNREKAAREMAEAAGRAKDSFLAALSHELRTPLNPVLLIASDSAENQQLSPDIREQFETILTNVEVEARLIDDLLDLTSINHGKLNLQLVTADAHAILREALRTIQTEVGAKKIQFTAALNAEQCWIPADRVRLRQIFWNVLKNAVKFTPGGGEIDVQTFSSRESGRFKVIITDTGIGMTAQELERIFFTFSQGDHMQENSARFGDLGLGLAISKKFVEFHSGQIEAFSSGRDHGTTVTIEFPLAQV